LSFKVKAKDIILSSRCLRVKDMASMTPTLATMHSWDSDFQLRVHQKPFSGGLCPDPLAETPWLDWIRGSGQRVERKGMSE